MLKTGWVTKLKHVYDVDVDTIIDQQTSEFFTNPNIDGLFLKFLVYDFLNRPINESIMTVPVDVKTLKYVHHYVDGHQTYGVDEKLYQHIYSFGFCDRFSVYKIDDYYHVIGKTDAHSIKLTRYALQELLQLLKQCTQRIIHDYLIQYVDIYKWIKMVYNNDDLTK